eukprot:g1920.t1
MADEPTASIVCVSDAHDDNGGKRKPSCNLPIDAHSDTTLSGHRKVMEAHDADLEKASRGLEPSRARVLADELHPAASPGALPARQLSSVAREVVSMSDGVDQPEDVRLGVASQRQAGGADDSANIPGEARQHVSGRADLLVSVSLSKLVL